MKKWCVMLLVMYGSISAMEMDRQKAEVEEDKTVELQEVVVQDTNIKDFVTEFGFDPLLTAKVQYALGQMPEKNREHIINHSRQQVADARQKNKEEEISSDDYQGMVLYRCMRTLSKMVDYLNKKNGTIIEERDFYKKEAASKACYRMCSLAGWTLAIAAGTTFAVSQYTS